MNEVTCFMLYYGRKAVAEESMESFLRQTYPHKKLIIINSHPDPVWFEKEYPDVEVYNKNNKDFENLNAKYMFALKQIKTPWWCPWDSDDIWLPWHLENLMAAETEGNGLPKKVGLAQTYVMCRDGDNPKRIGVQGQMAGGCVWETFDKDGKLYPFIDPKSTDFWDRQVIQQEWDRHWLDMKANPLSFIFRWYINKQYKPEEEIFHRSKKVHKKGLEYEKQLRTQMNKISLKEPWRPHWEEDYVEKVKNAKNTETCKVFHKQI